VEFFFFPFLSFSFSPSRNTVGSENPNTVGGLLGVVIVMNHVTEMCANNFIMGTTYSRPF